MTRGPMNGTGRRPSFDQVVPVVADDPPAPLHLSDNTNLFGTPPAALAAIRAAQGADIVQYPSSSGPELREAIAGYLGVQPNEVVVGCGGDNIIDCALRAFCAPGDAVAFPDPTFVMTRYFALTNGLTPTPVPIRSDAGTDVEGLILKRAPLTYLCAPNNPTGLQPSLDEQKRVLNDAAGIVMIDEAYGEFAGPSLAKEVVAHERSIIVRTFSKAFGLAGMRVGYGIGSRRLVREIEKARGPFLVSSVGLAAATAAITKDLSWITTHVAAAIDARQLFVRQLRERGFTPYESHGNFVLVPVPNAKLTAQRLAEQGISVRFFSGLTVIGDAVRITVAPIDAMQGVAAALAASVA